MVRRDILGALGALGAGITLGSSHLQAADHGGAGKSTESPVAGGHAHFCGIHVAKNNPKFQIVTQHYCTAHEGDNPDEQMFQCILFDTAAKNAKLLGVEYVISDKQYRSLPEPEKKYWHPHTYEVLGGGLIAPSMTADEEQKFMKMILTTWGKAWHTWPDPKTPVPMGDPLLIWSLTGEGQVDPKVLAARDREFKVSTVQIRDRRRKEFGFEVPRVSAPTSVDQISRQWCDEGPDQPTPAR